MALHHPDNVNVRPVITLHKLLQQKLANTSSNHQTKLRFDLCARRILITFKKAAAVQAPADLECHIHR